MTVDQFEAFVQQQQPARVPWTPVTDYSFDARQQIEGPHAQLIKEVFQPKRVLDVGCGHGHLVLMLRQSGVRARGCDVSAGMPDDRPWIFNADITDPLDEYTDCSRDLVICREVLEHLTVKQIRKAARNLCILSSGYVYVTTRFHPNPQSLLDVADHDDLDPTHITLLNPDFLRTLFVLEGFKRRADLEQQMDWQHKGRVLVYER